ncbi:hypothetical protein J6590_062998 [Homalodisca vitripennis]|nr:hypothetical protein J6590_062998 [Homalodisca vitripennis]
MKNNYNKLSFIPTLLTRKSRAYIKGYCNSASQGCHLVRVLKNGDWSWRSLGKKCNASIRSDAEVTVISVTNDKHTGQHPVTLRRMSSAAASPAQYPASQSPPSPHHSTPPTHSFTCRNDIPFDLRSPQHTHSNLYKHFLFINFPGVCKPGARLLQITSYQTQPVKSGIRCSVLIAATNELAAGEQRNIYDSLEKRITSLASHNRLIVATWPHRHDLPPTHDIIQHTAIVNAYIEEVVARHHIAVLDMNKLQRKYFTRHGMHLHTEASGDWPDTLWRLSAG